MTFGYDTRITHVLSSPPSTDTVYQIAGDLLVALDARRSNTSSLPIVFIVHSLGGIVLKQMLRRSYSSQLSQRHLHSICMSTKAAIFFGTPHGGADPCGIFLGALKKVFKLIGFEVNEQVVNTLLPNSERLMELRDEFAPMAQNYGWSIHSFQEGVGLKVLNWSKVVDDNSSYLSCPSIELTEHIAKNHMDMCRFASDTDIEYQKVVAALLRISKRLGNSTREPMRQEVDNSEVTPEWLLKLLHIEQINLRQMTIKKAHIETCKWFLSQPAYLQWLDQNEFGQHHGFLWIKGKPGSGKSTLMKYLFSQFHFSKEGEQGTLLSFFFNARGNDLQHNTQGMYRSLIIQLIQDDFELQQACILRVPSDNWPKKNEDWSLEVLKKLLGHALADKKGRVAIFIDALDECDEDEAREFISFLNELAEAAADRQQELQVCLSSRHYPHISIPRSLEVVLEREEGHSHDIASYLNSELNIGHSSLAKTVREQVLERASGIFIWVVLVVQILNQEYDHGQLHRLQQILTELPEDLDKLFMNLIERDTRDRGQLLFCIYLLLFSEPFGSDVFYHAVIAGTDIDSLAPLDDEIYNDEVISKFILSISRGLAEIHRTGRSNLVQFIHESVRQFFLKPQNITRIFPGCCSTFAEEGRNAIRRCSSAYHEYVVKTTNLPMTHIPTPSMPLTERMYLYSTCFRQFPFFPYVMGVAESSTEYWPEADLPRICSWPWPTQLREL
ncbi:hypothetical protein F4821DRAFT_128914 [Hypoxylon rubiginosum]|uniref:Uncharacterized protein n=1 Tax=Hypoxylon rubiginosum TaxID=110542 RepID=A0ACC0D0U9_9PEZI|nr:hypothetical protein F4821DRAFT_128914 [Hypoxylon rubiginosum]